MSEYQSLQIFDELGFSLNSNQLLFSNTENILIYSFGSNIIYYNLNNNTKTFIQITASNEIMALHFIDNYNRILLTISNCSSPLIYLWDLNNFENIYNQTLTIKDNYGIDFSIDNIFVEKVKNNYFFIFITSKNSNDFLLYKFYMVEEKYYLEPFYSHINQIKNDKSQKNKDNIIGFKYFLNSNKGVIIYNESIDFCELDSDNDKLFSVKKNIKYNFYILKNSYSISSDYNLLSFITSKGNCLLYDINYNNKTTINPYNQDDFIISNFFNDSLFLGTNNGKIFVYQLSDYQLKYYINYNKIYLFKKEFQINNNKNKENKKEYDKDYDYDGPSIDYFYCDEINDKIFIKMGDNSILLSPISFIIDNNNGYINDKLQSNTSLLYAYNHSNEITDIVFFPLSNNEIIDYPIVNDKIQTIFYSCSKEQSLIKYYINSEDNKLYNQYFDFYQCFNENNALNKKNKAFMNYFNVIKFHPLQKNYLYMGDTKGIVYILDINKNNIIYKQYIGETYSINSLSFNKKGNLLCLGLETGLESIYYINNLNSKQKFEKYILLNNHYFSPEEIEMRQTNSHILSYSYFFKEDKINENKIIYLKNNNRIECSLIIEKNNNYKKVIYDININNKILDIKMHKGENYIIILDDILQINIYDLTFKNNVGIIDLSEQVKYAYNIDIDISGLFLSLLCQLKDNNMKKSDIVLFETGTGNVHSFISGMNPINKVKFDSSGKYLVTAGVNGETCLLGLDEDAINSIQNVIEEINKNDKFLDEYEISFDNKKEKIILDNILNNKNEINSGDKINTILDRKQSNDLNKNEIQNNVRNKINTINNKDYSFKFNYDENNSSTTNKQKKMYQTENNKNIFTNLSNKTNNSKEKTLKYKTFPNISNKLHPLFASSNYINNKLYTNNTNSSISNSYKTNLFNYSTNKFNNVPKLSYINITHDKYNTFQNQKNINDKKKLNSFLKTKKEIQMKNINKAISELILDDENKEKEDNSKNVNKFSFSNNILNNNLSSFYSYDSNLKNKFSSYNDLNDIYNISRDFMFINNKKISRPMSFDKSENNSMGTTFWIYHKDKHKKYPEPKDIDDVENFYYINNNISNFLKSYS